MITKQTSYSVIPVAREKNNYPNFFGFSLTLYWPKIQIAKKTVLVYSISYKDICNLIYVK